jgi:hypothetical protein
MTFEEAQKRVGQRVERLGEVRPHVWEPLEEGVIIECVPATEDKKGIVFIRWDGEPFSEASREDDLGAMRPLGNLEGGQ